MRELELIERWRKEDLETIQLKQAEFLVSVALLKKTPEDVDKLIYKFESLRRDVIL